MGDYFVLENLSMVVHLFVMWSALRVLPALRRAQEHAAVASLVGIIAASVLAFLLYALGILREIILVLEGPADALVPLFHLSVACVMLLAVIALSHLQNRRGPADADQGKPS